MNFAKTVFAFALAITPPVEWPVCIETGFTQLGLSSRWPVAMRRSAMRR